MGKKVYLSELKPFKFDYKVLDEIVYFNWMCEYILEHFYSDDYEIELVREIHGYGPHWGGYCLYLKGNNIEDRIFIHAGLVYHPETESGIYLEAESWKNAKIYKTLCNNIESSTEYDLNKEESDFLKLFFPKEKLNKLMNSNDVSKQYDMLFEFYNTSFNAILKALNK